jgi:hypothetical protein
LARRGGESNGPAQPFEAAADGTQTYAAPRDLSGFAALTESVDEYEVQYLFAGQNSGALGTHQSRLDGALSNGSRIEACAIVLDCNQDLASL